MFNTCIYTNIYCGYIREACILAAEVLIEAVEALVVVVAVVDKAAAIVCNGGSYRVTVEESGTTGTTVDS